MPKPKLKMLLLLVLIGLVILLILKTERKNYDYYPKSSFKIPADVLRERIATVSAKTVRIPIVMYHYIEYVDRTKDPGRANLATPPNYLEREVNSLKQTGHTFLFAKDLPNIVSHIQNIPPKPVVLTFDDGYEDFYWNALPILKKYNVKATLYVIANFIGRRGLPPYLTIKELEEIRDSGLVEIGAHTLDHAYLKGLKVDVVRKEIFGSKADLEKLLGIPIVSFAYPYGAFDKQALEITKAAGFTNAVSVIPGVNQSEDNLYYFYRLRPGYLGYNDPAKSLDSYNQYNP